MKYLFVIMLLGLGGVAHAGIVADTYVTSIKNALDSAKENVSNKVTNLTPDATDVQYPSARAVHTALGAKVSVNGDENISGTKTFVASPIVPTPALPTE